MTVFLSLLFALAVLVFSVQNVIPVDVRFMGWGFRTTLTHVTLGATASGAIFALLLTLTRNVRGSLKVWEAQGKVRRLQGELKAAQEAQRKLEGELEQLKAPRKSTATSGLPGGNTSYQ
ncbi:MAG: LapA family protein [Bacillota bacterium]